MQAVWFGRIVPAMTAALIALSPLTARAAEERAPSIPLATALPTLHGVVDPVPAWTEWCERLPAECVVALSEPVAIEVTATVWAAIQAVNWHVNTTVKPMADAMHWGVADRWSLPDDGYGDCEDYQLQKRRLLALAGLPRRAMRMTAVLDQTGDGHAVLMIRTDRGDFILDNRTSDVLAWSDTQYEYIKREGSDGPAWIALNGKTQTFQVASR